MRYTRKRDVIGVGYMGPVEDDLIRAWQQAWQPIRVHVRSQGFLDQLGLYVSADTFIVLVESYVDRGADVYKHLAVGILNQVVITAGMKSESPLMKAAAGEMNPFRVGTGAWVRWEQRHMGPGGASLDPYTRYRDAAQHLTFGMVEGLTAKMKGKLRGIIVKAFEQKVRPEEIAQRVANIIGLNDRWTIAVENLRNAMVEANVPERWRNKRAEKYAEGLLFKRGVMVARTEMMTAINAGEYEAWKLRADRGELAGFVVEKWLQPKEDACDQCWSAADPDATGEPKRVRGLETAFEGIAYPPLHPHCRCTVGYRLVPATG